ncbi:bifunctional glutamate--cysteine ligase GshA/glutathione synthetase GshB [Clostridium sediminicola]|uniref:bifunctional glutamate--cysteine ligase GshA/glutathione synthetase GshB n=1 Tax=Clostridium sediminicola TaxID=3114879 RepID=UPI0031F24A4F
MSVNKFDFLHIIKKLNIKDDLMKGNFGLEKENVRVNESGELANTIHPEAFGSKLENPYITTDFSESQVEMITPVSNTIEECYNCLENIHRIVSAEIKKEYLWPQSSPPKLPNEDEIKIAKYEDCDIGRKAKQYRENIANTYGKKKLLISGIHYNFSFQDDLLKRLYSEINEDKSFREFKDEIYLKISRNFFRYGWILIYLFGASPIVHKSYEDKKINDIENFNEDSMIVKDTISLRNGVHGYKNSKDLSISYNSLKEYVNDIRKVVANGDIQSPKEYYSHIRLKTKKGNDILKDLLEGGIDYLEIRVLDINPFMKIGIDVETLYFVHLFMLYSLFKSEDDYHRDNYLISLQNNELVASFGRQEDLMLYKDNNEKVSLKDMGSQILNEISEMISFIGLNDDKLTKIVNEARNKILDSENIPSSKLINATKDSSYLGFHMERIMEELEAINKNEFNLIGYEDLELSTQILIKDAIKRGVSVEVIDRDENFIMLSKGNKIEYIKQATKTSLDSYSSILIMENKVITKMMLEKSNIRVPKGQNYRNINGAKKDYNLFKNRKIVIKPKSTNFGLGITIFKENFTRELYERAIDIAFNHDNSIMIEEFISGKEYRIFVIGDEVVGILHRVPANVTGDGVKNISELVAEKNKDPLRGKGYKTPLEKIKLEEAEEMFLHERGKDFNYIPKLNETVFLRENSNISTGGDSIDYTDDILDEYKEIAVAAAKAVGATICGVDMMINDINTEFKEENYGIIELNFNPAIHIHCYPYRGKNRKLGDKILDALGF